MGIDIGTLDLCILVGYPGSIINTWQRGGRVGRAERESAILLLAQPDALDQYFMRHPQDFFARSFEAAVLDPDNPEVLKLHLPCAASELPLLKGEPFFPWEAVEGPIKSLVEQGILLEGHNEEGKRFFSRESHPQRKVDIRSSGHSYTILELGSKKVIGHIDGVRAFKEGHPGAVYLHQGQQYLVESLDISKNNIWVKPQEVSYYTRIHAHTDTQILSVDKSKPAGNFLVRLGEVRVEEKIEEYEKRRIAGQELLGTYGLELPVIVFETVGLWLEIEEELIKNLEKNGFHPMGSLHALEHAAISIFPLFALCDRNDLGGVSTTYHSQVQKGAIFLYDGYPGGVGLAERGYEMIIPLLEKTLAIISECPCFEGCPSCIHSPKCGSGNKPLDKEGCKFLLEMLLGITKFNFNNNIEMIDDCSKVESEKSLITNFNNKRIGVFDLETQRLAAEVGGWHNKHLMRLSVGVIFDCLDGTFREYREHEIDQLLQDLKGLDLIIGFNIKSFDFKVLSAYSPMDFSTLPVLDILDEVAAKLGFRLSLDHLAQNTLGTGKTADGFKAVEWFRKGQWDELTEYCRQDVAITRDLFFYGQEKGYILFKTRDGGQVRLPVNWKFNDIFSQLIK
jgi:DEAD/DEAH box helicase domain-containing protein